MRRPPPVYTSSMPANSRPRALALIAMLLLAPAQIRAEDAPRSSGDSAYELSVASGFGLLYGASLELVYKDSLSDSLLSELYWPMQPLVYWSSALYLERIAPGPRFFASLGLDSGFYSYTGTMTDKDWTTSSSQYTHFSAHDCYTERSLFMDLTLGMKSYLGAGLSFSYLASLSLMDFFWTARDGFLKYPPSYEAIKVWGTGISYEQFWLSLSYGIALDWAISKCLTLSAILLVKPLALATDEDKHLFRLEQFNETLYGAFGIDPSLSLQLSFTERLGALVRLSYRGLWGARGDTVHTEMDTGTLIGVYHDGAGAGYNAIDLSVSLVSRL